MPKKSTPSPTAKARRDRNREANQSRATANRTTMLDAGLVAEAREVVRRVPSGKPGQTREVTVVRSVRPSKTLRNAARAEIRAKAEKERAAVEAARLERVRAVAAATVAAEPTP